MEKLLARPIAHRGLHNDAHPENSMAAFENAINNGYNIEIDVRLLKDGHVVVFHDANTKRMIGKKAKISQLTLADIKGDQYLLPNGESIPLLSELLELIDGKVGLLVELKAMGISAKLEKAVYKLIYGKQDWVFIQSFNPFTVKWFNKYANEITRGQLAIRPKNTFFNFMYFYVISGLSYRFGKYHFLAYDARGITYKRVAKLVEEKKIKLAIWTINDDEKLASAIEAKADLFIFEKITPDEAIAASAD